jgi:Tripartite tricarboxylate transporter family receptor
VSAKSPYRSLAEIVEKGKAIPNTLKFVSVGPGSPHHLGVELISLQTGAKFIHVPYRREGPMIAALQQSEIDFWIFTPIQVLGTVQSGATRALAATCDCRARGHGCGHRDAPEFLDPQKVAKRGGIEPAETDRRRRDTELAQGRTRQSRERGGDLGRIVEKAGVKSSSHALAIKQMNCGSADESIPAPVRRPLAKPSARAALDRPT